MILSGTITLDPATHAASTAAVRLRLEQLDERRRCAGLAVDRALATWHGDAAEVCRARWEEWDRGALAVIEQLSYAAHHLDQVRLDLATADDSSAGVTGRIAGATGMTTYEVDLDELRETLGELASCQRDLISLAGDLDSAQERLHYDWAGVASAAQATSYASCRTSCADMVTALAALRGIVTAADAHYARAVSANLELWRQVAP